MAKKKSQKQLNLEASIAAFKAHDFEVQHNKSFDGSSGMIKHRKPFTQEELDHLEATIHDSLVIARYIVEQCTELVEKGKREKFEGYDLKTDTCYRCVENVMSGKFVQWHCHICGAYNAFAPNFKCECGNQLPETSLQMSTYFEAITKPSIEEKYFSCFEKNEENLTSTEN